MIKINELKTSDIGRQVSYLPRDNKNRKQLGVLTKFNKTEVLIKYSTTPEKLIGEKTNPRFLTFTTAEEEYQEWIDLDLEGLMPKRYKLNIRDRKVKSMVSKGNIHESKSGNVSLSFNVDTLIKLMKDKTRNNGR